MRKNNERFLIDIFFGRGIKKKNHNARLNVMIRGAAFGNRYDRRSCNEKSCRIRQELHATIG